MNDAMIDLALTLFQKVISGIKAFFWKNDMIIYLNSTKGIIAQGDIKRIGPKRDTKIINLQANFNKASLHKYKHHFLKMRESLYQIGRNLSGTPEIYYGGLASTPFAVFDGYCLGNTREYHLFDNSKDSQEKYVITFKPKLVEAKYGSGIDTIEIPSSSDEVNLVIETSGFSVNSKDIKQIPTYHFAKRLPEKIRKEDLLQVYSYVYNFVQRAGNQGVKTIHLYVAAKQPVSFAVGTAIQHNAPSIKAYEYFHGKYVNYLDFASLKIHEIK